MYSIKMQYKCVTFFMITHIFEYLLQDFFQKEWDSRGRKSRTVRNWFV